MAAQYGMSMYITDIKYGVLDLPFLPEEFEIKFDGNDMTDYLANGQFYTQKKLPKPKEIELSCFFPSVRTTTQVNKGLNYTNFMYPSEWKDFFFKCLDKSRIINICFPWWDFDMDCTVSFFNPKIVYAEVDDIYYTVKFLEYGNPTISPLTTIRAQGHNSWITAGEWQLIGGSAQQTVNLLPYIDPNAQSSLSEGAPTATEDKATVPKSEQTISDILPTKTEVEKSDTAVKAEVNIDTTTTGAVEKEYITKDSNITISGNYRYLVNFSRQKYDINSPKYDILKDSKYGSDPFYTRGFKGDSSYSDIYKYIENNGKFEVLEKFQYQSIFPAYSTIIYKIRPVVKYNTTSHISPALNLTYYASAEVIDSSLVISEYIKENIKR